jgi:hypothetical protein
MFFCHRTEIPSINICFMPSRRVSMYKNMFLAYHAEFPGIKNCFLWHRTEFPTIKTFSLAFGDKITGEEVLTFFILLKVIVLAKWN